MLILIALVASFIDFNVMPAVRDYRKLYISPQILLFMTLDKLVVTFLGFLAILFVYFYFLKKKDREVEVMSKGEESFVDVVVEGGYSPSTIIIPKDKTTKISFLRKDSNACLEEVVLGDFRIKKYLPLNEKVTVEINPKQSGEFTYSCGMNMYHGKIVVK